MSSPPPPSPHCVKTPHLKNDFMKALLWLPAATLNVIAIGIVMFIFAVIADFIITGVINLCHHPGHSLQRHHQRHMS